MPLYTATYDIKVEVALGSHASLFEAEIAAEKLVPTLLVHRIGYDAEETVAALPAEVTLTGLGENPQEHARDRVAMKHALHGFVQAYADLAERGEHIPYALQSAHRRATEVLKLAPKGEKPKEIG